MIKSLLLTFLIVVICVLLMGVKVFFSKNGTFPNTHIGSNKAMKKRGIHCAKTQDAIARQGGEKQHSPRLKV